MSKILYANYAGIKNEHHIPDAIAQSNIRNGSVVVAGIDENGKHTAKLPESADECKGELWFVWNVMDKPELLHSWDYIVKEGDFARIFKFEPEYQMYVSADTVNGEVEVGKYLVADDSDFGKLMVTDDASGYAVAMQVTEIVYSYGSYGYECDTLAV